MVLCKGICLAPQITLSMFLKTTVLNYSFCSWEEMGSRSLASSVCLLESGPKLDLSVGRANCIFWLCTQRIISRLLIHPLSRRLKNPWLEVKCWQDSLFRGELFWSVPWLDNCNQALEGVSHGEIAFDEGQRKEAGLFLTLEAAGGEPWVTADTMSVQGQERC